MKISTKGRYALRMLMYLAEHKDSGFIPLNRIAESQNISKQYLERIVGLLNSQNILSATRGKQGGYALAKEPSEYTVGQILRIVEGNNPPVPCLEQKINSCDNAAFCYTLPMWTGLKKVVDDYVDGITLQNMLDQYRESRSNFYVI